MPLYNDTPHAANGGLIPIEQALASLLEQANTERQKASLPILQALGRTLAETIVAPMPVPPADNSAMDGYALRLADATINKPLAISQRVAAGDPPEPLLPGTVARIFTGGQIPDGADCVIMQENSTVNDGQVSFTSLPKTVGNNIRLAGEDIKQGATILKPGISLRPQDLGLLASIGLANVSVYEPLRVAVLSTGSELVEPGQPISKGKLYNSNRPMLLAMLSELGFKAIDAGICGDDFSATKEALKQAAESADVVITSGGVSVGEEDHVKAAVDALGHVALWKIAIKPGKPFVFGNIGSTPFLGLPGNPASVFTTFLILARPFLLACQGNLNTSPQTIKLPAGFSRKPVSRQEYLRVRIVDGQLMPFSQQGSGVLTSASWADGFAIQKIGKEITPGEGIDYLPFSALLNQ